MPSCMLHEVSLWTWWLARIQQPIFSTAVVLQTFLAPSPLHIVMPKPAVPPVPPRILSEERCLVKMWIADGEAPSECACRLHRNRSSITRFIAGKLRRKRKPAKLGRPGGLTDAQKSRLFKCLKQMVAKAAGTYEVTYAMRRLHGHGCGLIRSVHRLVGHKRTLTR